MSERIENLKRELKKEQENYSIYLELCKKELLIKYMHAAMNVVEAKIVKHETDTSIFADNASALYNELSLSIEKAIDAKSIIEEANNVIEKHRKCLVDLFQSQIDYVINEIDTLLKIGFLEEENICTDTHDNSNNFIYVVPTKFLNDLKSHLERLKLCDNLSQESLLFDLNFTTENYSFLDTLLYEISTL